ncbi:hypothetical protein S40285_06038 [Stachybotrys chlorohalonatus IBT 40285]|uniref:Uncharacterized protein n=1 Tax=Stachybotrys chlorohalonatus (strain IBT 40285) TaxID=1283841 RepID=A0A084Q8S1_STAC4|nr:hypothetical protein S40285_06038 [Stachybotrys chlorohalonata IBT 40285]
MHAAAQATIVKRKSYQSIGQSQRYPRAITPLHMAVFFGLREVASSLLSYADDEDGHRMMPLAWAAQQGDVDVMEMLIDNGAEPDYAIQDEVKSGLGVKEGHWNPLAGRTALSLAAEHGGQKYNEAVRLLLNKGLTLFPTHIASRPDR